MDIIHDVLNQQHAPEQTNIMTTIAEEIGLIIMEVRKDKVAFCTLSIFYYLSIYLARTNTDASVFAAKFRWRTATRIN